MSNNPGRPGSQWPLNLPELKKRLMADPEFRAEYARTSPVDFIDTEKVLVKLEAVQKAVEELVGRVEALQASVDAMQEVPK